MKWVNYDEKKPSKYGYYLTWDSTFKLVCARASCDVLKFDPRRGYFEKYNWGENKTEAYFPTHWMEIPQPPKEP